MNIDFTIIAITASALLYMALGYRLLSRLSKRKDVTPAVMMSGFDSILYEEGEKYGRCQDRKRM